MGGHLIMSEKERKRLKVLERVARWELKLTDASKLLGLSYRHTKRVNKNYKESGDYGLVHKSRGRQSNRAMDKKKEGKILDIYKREYSDFGPTFASECLLEKHGYKIDHETLRKKLLKNKLWTKKRERKKHRKRRERKEHFGEMVQMDGSPHDWFEGRSEECCLCEMVDDATGITFGQFDEEETKALAMKVLWGWIKKYGLPHSLYVDWKNIFHAEREPTVEEQLRNEKPLTDFERACKKLGIQIIFANSPQAKGRVERKHGVCQDRLVKTLRMEKINEIVGANKFLSENFLDKLNDKFSKQPAKKEDYHLPVPEGLDLRTVFCFEERRTVCNDWTVQYNNRIFQIIKDNKKLPRSGDKITVAQWLDSTIHLIYKNEELKYEELKFKPTKKQAENVFKKKIIKKYIPPYNHPWRQSTKAAYRKNAPKLPLGVASSINYET